MNKNTQIRILNFLLILMIGLGCFALYLNFQVQEEYEDTLVANMEEYDYEVIQDLVTFPQEELFEVPYDIKEMLSINEDFKGWLWIPETSVNYPVVQTDNNSTYLTTSFQGDYSSFGSLFLDKDSISGSRNRVIHGHNMGSTRTEMFSSLVGYQDQSWAKEREVAYFTEPEAMEDAAYQLFAVLNFNIKDLDEFNYMKTNFDTEDDFQAFIDYLKNRSVYDTEFYPQRDTLILSTCNRAYGKDNRLLICFGRPDAVN